MLSFTRFTAVKPARLSKRFTLSGDTLVKEGGGELTEGIAEKLSVAGLAEFAALLPTLTPKQALSYGINGHAHARVVTAAALAGAAAQSSEPVIARTRDHFTWPAGAGLLMLDYDAPPDGPALLPDELRATLTHACPALADAPAVWRPSASSCIYTKEGAERRGIAGQRLYVAVTDAADIPRALPVLFDRLWLAGFGRYELSKSGAWLARTVIDASVAQPERLDFCGGADCGRGLEQRLPAPILFNTPAPYLDTRAALPDLDADERQRLAKRREALKAPLRERQREIREAWIATRVAARLSALPEPDRAEARPKLERVYREAANGGRLEPDFELIVVGRGTKARKRLTVGELLKARATYHEATTLDPLEPDYPDGQARLVGWLNLNAREPYLQSQAHGGTRYLLGDEARTQETQETPDSDMPDWFANAPDEPIEADASGGQAGNTGAIRDYVTRNAKTFWIKHGKDGDEYVFLANFAAEIVAETIIDDGAERKRRMEITGRLADGPLPVAGIPSGQFAAMNWIGSEWGSAAQIAPGMGLKDRLRYAIQVLSTAIQYQTVYEHTGWREMDGCWLYLSQNAVISSQGLRNGVNVELSGALADYALALPPHPAAAVQASLTMLDCAPPPIAVPLFLASYRALISEALPGDFSLFLAGVTGSRKTEIAAILQGHFGDAWHGKHLPGSWSSTANSLERAAFLAKDAVFVVDDFCPNGTTTDIARFHRDADRLLRAQGNRAGRQRMNADGSLRPAYYPRGLIVATGEDIPRGQSLRGRLLILEFSAETVNLDTLTLMQQHAGAGTLAAAAGAFCQWLAPRITQLKKALPERRNQLRNEINAQAHSRHPDTLAGLMITAELFAEFAGAQGIRLPLDWTAQITEALLQAGKDQQHALAAEEPAARFVRLIESALAAGRCHLKPMDGKPLSPMEDFTRYGWQLKTFGVGESERTDWHECGPSIGRFKPEEPGGIYLDPEASYGLAQRLAEEQGHAIPLQQRSLFKALLAKGYLLARNELPRLTVKMQLPDKTLKRFLHVRVGGQHYGKSGKSGNFDPQANDFEKEKAVASSGKNLNEVGKVGNTPPAIAVAVSHFSQSHTDFSHSPNDDNKLFDKENSSSFPSFPTFPSYAPPHPDYRDFSEIDTSIAATLLHILQSAPGGMRRDDLERVIAHSHPKAGPALVKATIDRLMLDARIAPQNDRLVVVEVRS